MSKYYPEVTYDSWEKTFTIMWSLEYASHIKSSLAPKTFDSPAAVQAYLIECCRINPTYEVTLEAEIKIQKLFAYIETWINYQEKGR